MPETSAAGVTLEPQASTRQLNIADFMKGSFTKDKDISARQNLVIAFVCGK